MNKLQQSYFDWLYKLVTKRNHKYKELLHIMDSVPFRYTNPMDANREDDAIALRYRFGDENDIPDIAICSEIDTRPASVLEVLVAIAFRCEDIVWEGDSDYKLYIWFTEMLDSLDLSDQVDGRADEVYIRGVIDKFLDRKYAKDGTGSIFIVNDGRHDMRNAQLWDQMCWYINTITS